MFRKSKAAVEVNVDEEASLVAKLAKLPEAEKRRRVGLLMAASGWGCQPAMRELAQRDVEKALRERPASARLQRLKTALESRRENAAVFLVDAAMRSGEPLHELVWGVEELRSILNPPPPPPSLAEVARTDAGRARACRYWAARLETMREGDADYETTLRRRDACRRRDDGSFSEIEKTLSLMEAAGLQVRD